MSKIDMVLASGAEPTNFNPSEKFAVELHSSNTAKDADKLVEMWPVVMSRLHKIIDQSGFPNSSGSRYQLDTIEVHLGIEAGFTIGFAAKTNADLTLTFKLPSPAAKP